MRKEDTPIKNTKDTPFYSIGTVARMLGVSVHTLRMYEREGLMLPYKKESSHRLYSDMDVERLRCIRHAINEEKISIAGIRRIYALIPCWQVVKCSDSHRSKCPAYSEHTKPCWTYDHIQNPCTKLDCRLCDVYKLSSDCGKIKEMITNRPR
ncbi:MAG: MerR family transcriptional regulator [bacterium]